MLRVEFGFMSVGGMSLIVFDVMLQRAYCSLAVKRANMVNDFERDFVSIARQIEGFFVWVSIIHMEYTMNAGFQILVIEEVMVKEDGMHQSHEYGCRLGRTSASQVFDVLSHRIILLSRIQTTLSQWIVVCYDTRIIFNGVEGYFVSLFHRMVGILNAHRVYSGFQDAIVSMRCVLMKQSGWSKNCQLQVCDVLLRRYARRACSCMIDQSLRSGTVLQIMFSSMCRGFARLDSPPIYGVVVLSQISGGCHFGIVLRAHGDAHMVANSVNGICMMIKGDSLKLLTDVQSLFPSDSTDDCCQFETDFIETFCYFESICYAVLGMDRLEIDPSWVFNSWDSIDFQNVVGSNLSHNYFLVGSASCYLLDDLSLTHLGAIENFQTIMLLSMLNHLEPVIVMVIIRRDVVLWQHGNHCTSVVMLKGDEVFYCNDLVAGYTLTGANWCVLCPIDYGHVDFDGYFDTPIFRDVDMNKKTCLDGDIRSKLLLRAVNCRERSSRVVFATSVLFSDTMVVSKAAHYWDIVIWNMLKVGVRIRGAPGQIGGCGFVEEGMDDGPTSLLYWRSLISI